MNVGIMVEGLQRWLGPERNVQAMTRVHVPERRNAETNAFEPVRVPDSFTAMGELVSGADYVYQWSGLAHHEPATEVWLYGDRGTLVYDFDHDTIAAPRRTRPSCRRSKSRRTNCTTRTWRSTSSRPSAAGATTPGWRPTCARPAVHGVHGGGRALGTQRPAGQSAAGLSSPAFVAASPHSDPGRR